MQTERNLVILIGAVVILAILSVIMVSLTGGAVPDFSDGGRSGVVVKLSHKGLIWKSWEGEMLTGGMAKDSEGTMVPAKWRFSLPKGADPKTVKAIQDAATSGERVTLTYREWLIKPIIQSTGYTVTAVEQSKH